MKHRMYLCAILLVIIIFGTDTMNAQQISIGRIDMMPDMPAPYVMRDWKQTARGYDSLVFNRNLTGQYLPLIFYKDVSENYPEHGAFGLHTVVGTPYTLNGEGINVMPAVIGASLVGIDKTNQDGYNYVLMCENFFNRRPAENIYLNGPNASSGDDWWYETMPNVFFYQLYSLYPNTGDFKNQFNTVADRWLQAVNAMGASLKPWTVPKMDYRAFRFSTLTPNGSGVHEPEAAGAIAWILYNAFTVTGEEKYRQGAELAMEFLNGLQTNPAYELQLPYGVYMAARMNAELGTQYDIKKMTEWCFDVGPLRSWGAIIGNWGGYDVSGLIGENSSNDYAFLMNNFEQAGALVPMVRYDKRFARAIGKWVLNIANAARLFYPKYLPAANQDSYDWSSRYDSGSYIAHEAIRKNVSGNSPYATGDAISGGWGRTNLALYGSSHVGVLASIVDTTEVQGILKLDLLKTDYFHGKAYPTYLYYNPYPAEKQVKIDMGAGSHDLYDAVSGTFLLRGASGLAALTLPADQAVLAVIAPAGGAVTYINNTMLIAGIPVDYQSGQTAVNYPPRIKSLAADSLSLFAGSKTKLYCTASDRNQDQISFKWGAAGGAVSGTGAQAEWTAPFSAGTFSVYCTVSDGKGGTDSASVKIEIYMNVITPPLIDTIKASPGKSDVNGTIKLSVSARNAGGGTAGLSYKWTALSGTISGTGPSVSWKAPGTEGNYYAALIVTDSTGAAAADSVLIEVRDFSQYPLAVLAAWYPFSGNANDMSGNKLNGTPLNVSPAADRQGHPGAAYMFSAASSCVTVPSGPLLNFQTAITVDFWMQPSALPQKESFPISHGSWQNRWKVSITPERHVRWTVKTLTGVKDLDSRKPVQKDSLYNVAAVYTGKDMELYINGELDNFTSFSGLIAQTTYDLTIGQMLPGDFNYGFTGIIDDIRIYNGTLLPSDINSLYKITTGIKEAGSERQPSEFQLYQNFPNPFNLSTRIRYSLPDDSYVIIKIFNALGSEVARLDEGWKSKGVWDTEFSGHTKQGNTLSSGLYIYRIEAAGRTQSKAMLLIK
ncbi:MAG: LamG-like jellyroll fold domain-containing protein [Syntrophothermus sp.]